MCLYLCLYVRLYPSLSAAIYLCLLKSIYMYLYQTCFMYFYISVYTRIHVSVPFYIPSYICEPRDSEFGIETRCGMEGPRIEYRSGRDSPHPSKPTLGPTRRPPQRVAGLSQDRVPGSTIHPPYLSPELKEE